MIYLGAPPPLAGMHVMIEPHRLILICIMSLWCEYKVGSELRVPKQRPDTLNNIPEVYVKRLARKNDLLSFEAWAARNLGINDFIELIRILE